MSPSIAGPIEGVHINPPNTLEPGNGRSYLDRDQPLVLQIGNPTSNGVRPVTIQVEIAADSGFSAVVFRREGLTPGSGDRTVLPLGDKLQAGRTYYWRARADDGANKSGWSDPSGFTILMPVVLGTPNPREPIANVRVASGTPEFRVANGVSTGPYAPLTYWFQVADNANFVTVFANAEIGEGSGGETRYVVPQLPAPDRTFYWRVRIYDGFNLGSWSRVETFRSPVAVAPPPPPTAPPPSGSAGSPTSCKSSAPEQIVSCIGAKYPARLVAGVSLSQRQENMAFIRDRIIETGKCSGFNWGWNLKRGGPDLSIDFLAWRTGAEDLGVDIAFDYDNTSQPLRLQWAIHGPGAFFAAYPNVNCG